MSAAASSKPIGEGLFTWPATNPALLGSRCRGCGRVVFPANPSCTACGGEEVDVVELPRQGKLWAWTVQRFMPKTPYSSDETEQTFKQYGLGYIELAGALRVETRLTVNDPAQLVIGSDWELVIYQHRTAPDGTAVMNYAFKPV